MIAEHLKCDTLLGHCHDCFFVHVGIVNAHAAEDGECFHEVFVVFGKGLERSPLQFGVNLQLEMGTY